MYHHDDVGAALERFAIASLLVLAITQVLFVKKSSQTQRMRQLSRGILAPVIDQQHPIDEIERQIVISPFQRPGGVIGRHYDNYFFVVKHSCDSQLDDCGTRTWHATQSRDACATLSEPISSLAASFLTLGH